MIKLKNIVMEKFDLLRMNNYTIVNTCINNIILYIKLHFKLNRIFYIKYNNIKINLKDKIGCKLLLTITQLIPQDKIDKNKLVLLNKLNNIEIVFITPTEIQYKYSNVNKIDTDIKQIKYLIIQYIRLILDKIND